MARFNVPCSWQHSRHSSKSFSTSFACPASAHAFIIDSSNLHAVEEDCRSSRVRFCVDEPLCMQDSSLCSALAMSPEFQIPTPTPYPQYSRTDLSYRAALCH